MKNNSVNLIESVFDNLIQYAHEKNLDGTLLQYDNSVHFKFINEKGEILNSKAFAEMFAGLMNMLDYVNIYESLVSVNELNAESALCIWQGKEKIKMKGADEVDSSWTATVLLKKFEESWKVMHFHATHF